MAFSGLLWRPEKARKCSAAQGPHSEVVPRTFWRLVSKSCDECKGSFARGCEAKPWAQWTCSSLGTVFQPMRINSIPDVKCFCNNKNMLCAQSMVWHFVRHSLSQPCWNLNSKSFKIVPSSSCLALQLWYSLGLLNNSLPLEAILNLFCPFFEFHLLKVVPDIVFPSTQVFLGFPLSTSECWDGSPVSKLLLHASHVAHVCVCGVVCVCVCVCGVFDWISYLSHCITQRNGSFK